MRIRETLIPGFVRLRAAMPVLFKLDRLNVSAEYDGPLGQEDGLRASPDLREPRPRSVADQVVGVVRQRILTAEMRPAPLLEIWLACSLDARRPETARMGRRAVVERYNWEGEPERLFAMNVELQAATPQVAV